MMKEVWKFLFLPGRLFHHLVNLCRGYALAESPTMMAGLYFSFVSNFDTVQIVVWMFLFCAVRAKVRACTAGENICFPPTLEPVVPKHGAAKVSKRKLHPDNTGELIVHGNPNCHCNRTK